MDEYLKSISVGPYLLGSQPSFRVGSAIAPTLFRMLATLPVVRDLDLMQACRELKLRRLIVWLSTVLERPDK